MKRKFLHDISINTLQLVIVQGCGLIVFYLLSTRLEKNDFGEINWTLAVLLTAFGILALGIDQIAIRRIASGADPAQLLSTYLNHILLAGGFFYCLLWISSIMFPSFFTHHNALLVLGFGKLMIFFSTAFKQVANGLEKFRQLLFMAVTSNVLRAILLIVFSAFYQLDLYVIIIVFVITDLVEFLVCVFIMRQVLKVPLKIKWNRAEYKSLVTEALPQFGVAIFNAALSRVDWIFLGVLATNVVLAEYSFAYKVFEMATLPMLVIAPVLIPRFTKLFRAGASELPKVKADDLFILLRLEIIIASFVILVLNILWVPVIDMLTDNKYGAVNQVTIFILSASMPFLYFNNFLWTINFAKGHQKMIFHVFLISFIINLAGDILLIPYLNAEGAAIAYLLAIIIQSVLYFKNTDFNGVKENAYQLLICPLAAITSYLLITILFTSLWVIILIAPVFYFFLLYSAKQIRFADWLAFKRVTGM